MWSHIWDSGGRVGGDGPGKGGKASYGSGSGRLADGMERG